MCMFVKKSGPENLMFYKAMFTTLHALHCSCSSCWHYWGASTCDMSCVCLISSAATLTEFVTDAFILQQGGVFEGVAAIQDPHASVQRSDATQCQHRVVYEQGGWLLSEPRQNRAVAAILWITED